MGLSDSMLEAYGQKKIDEVRYWVYVLDCREREWWDSFDDIERYAEKRLGEAPEWLRTAWESNEYLYVGQTENLEKRLGEHFHGKKTTRFTQLYEPISIKYLEPANSRRNAEWREEEIATSYYDSDDTFAYYA